MVRKGRRRGGFYRICAAHTKFPSLPQPRVWQIPSSDQIVRLPYHIHVSEVQLAVPDLLTIYEYGKIRWCL